MGRKDKKRKHEICSSSSDEERHHKKHRKEKKDRKDDKERKKLKEAKKFLKQKLKNAEEASLDPNAEIPTLTQDSYFQRNPEFTEWLQLEKNLFFQDLPTIEARQLFQDFISKWNSRLLPKRFYAGIPATQARRSQHSWKIRGPGVEATKLGMAAAMEEEREAQAEERNSEKAGRRKWREDQKLLLDEMLPKATGRDAAIEKRQVRREEARAREASPDITHLPGGGDIYGTDDSFAAAQARETKRGAHKSRQAAWREDLGAAKLQEARAKEDERMAQFKALAARGPITIAKRL